MLALFTFRSLAALVITLCVFLGDLATAQAAPRRSRSAKSAKSVSAQAPRTESAATKKRIAILDLSGPKARAVRGALEDAAGEHYELISPKEYKSTAKRLKARTMRPRDVKKVAGALELAAVINGRVKKEKKHYEVRLTIHPGATGNALEQVELKLPLKLNSKSRGEVRTQFAVVVIAVPSSAQETREAPGQGDEPRTAEAPRTAKRGASGGTPPASKPSTGSSKPASAVADDDGTPYPIHVKFNKRGQAVDDEAPPVRKKR